LVTDLRQADGWGIGFYQGGEVLLQRRPKQPITDVDFYALAAELRTDVLIGHVREATVGGVKNENTHPFRFRSWLFAHHGTIPQFATLEPELRARIPDFLRRNIRGETDSEHLFHLFLAFLHEGHRLDDPALTPKAAGQALSKAVTTLEQLSPPGAASDLDLIVTNGRILLALKRGRPMAHYRINGIRDCPVCREVSEHGRGSRQIHHDHLRGLVLLTDPPAELPPPWQTVPENQLISVHSDLRIEMAPFTLA
jgi:predicted glutamine amidotransferase